MQQITELLDKLLMFEPDDIGRGIGDILDTMKTICLIILGIFLVILILWVLSHVFGGGSRG